MRILLLEDCSLDAELISAAIRRSLKCHITTVRTRTEFELALKGCIPDVILSDSNLPTFDGSAARAVALKACPLTPFVFCSGSDSPQLKMKALAHGRSHWISKNDLGALVALIKNLADHAEDCDDLKHS
jgi:CheY-like chemotaxis protein